MVTLTDMAEIADKLTRNEVLTSNELRAGLGMKPSKEPKADQLNNPNMPQNNNPPAPPTDPAAPPAVPPEEPTL
jgi:hypothetical protein